MDAVPQIRARQGTQTAERPRRCGPGSRVPAQTDTGCGRHPKDWAPQTEGGGSPHGLGLGCLRNLPDHPFPLQAPGRRSGVRPPPPAPPPLTPPPLKPTPTSAPNDSLRGPAGCQARSRGAHPAPPAFPGPRSPSSDPRRRGSKAALAPPPAAAPGARSLVEPRGPPPASPNQSPGLSPGSRRGGAAAGGGSRAAPPPAAGPASSRPHRPAPGYLESPEILPGRAPRPLAGPGGYGCFPTLCPPAISAWQGQVRTPRPRGRG